MARSIRTIIAKALWGREMTALIEEHNTLVDELDELKTKFAALAAKIDEDTTAQNLVVNGLAAKLDTDFTAQNAAVAASQLDVDYGTEVVSALSEDYAETVALAATEAQKIA